VFSSASEKMCVIVQLWAQICATVQGLRFSTIVCRQISFFCSVACDDLYSTPTLVCICHVRRYQCYSSLYDAPGYRNLSPWQPFINHCL